MQINQQITTINAAVLRRDNLMAAHPLANGDSSVSVNDATTMSMEAASPPASVSTESTPSAAPSVSVSPSASKQAEISPSQQIARFLLSGQPRTSGSSFSDSASPFAKLKGLSSATEGSAGGPIQVSIVERLFRFLSLHWVSPSDIRSDSCH